MSNASEPSRNVTLIDRTRPRLIFATGVAAAFLAVSLWRVLLHVPWRDEVRAWQLVQSVSSLVDLREATKYDGHPPLWSIALYVLSKFTSDFRAVQVLHVVIASAAVWVLCRFAPWRRWQCVLACFGYFVCFEYAIISRNYAFGLMFLFGALACFDRRDRRLLFAICCAGAVLSNPFVTLLAAALGLAALVDDIGRWRREQVRPRAIDFAWIAIPIFGAAFALWTMLPGPDARYASPYDGSAPLQRAAGTMIGFWQALVPIPASVDAWWNTALLSLDADSARHTRAMFYTLATIGFLAAITIGWLFRRDRVALTFLLAGWTIVYAFAFWQFAGTMRHQGHYVLAILGAWWLANRSREPAEPSSYRSRDVVLSILLGVQALAGVVASYRDLTQPFTAAQAAGAWLRDNSRGLKLIGNPDYAAVPVAAAAGQPFFSPESFSFTTWNTQGPRSPRRPASNDEPNLLAAILRETGERQMLLIRNALTDARPGESVEFDITTPGVASGKIAMTPLISFSDSAIESEQYTILLITLSDEPR